MTHNFSAGPGILPKEVIKEASEAALNYHNGLSILEMSHRSKPIVDIMEEAEALIKELLKIPDGYAVLFLTGGASTQFFMSAMNILGESQTAGYIDTGAWSSKAIKEAKQYGNIKIVGSSADQNYNYIPKELDLADDLRYLHYTSNNTIFGTQFKKPPSTSSRLVCDMSSDIFGYEVDISKYDLIYAGAQKNLGPAGTTLVIVKEDILGKVDRHIPTMLDYQTHIKKKSAFNTPPVYPIFVCLLTLRWLKQNGGLNAMRMKNEEKAQLLYTEIDRNSLFKGTVAAEDRSNMNVCFLCAQDSLTDKFFEEATAAGMSGIKGHRSVGGFRTSIYNAMPKSSVEAFVYLMQNFEKQYG